MLPIDAGNSLFAEFYKSGPEDQAKADLIAQAMAGMGVQVIGVGMRDLSAGPEFIAALAKKHKLQPLSANLARDGKLIFKASTILNVGGVKVGVIGASPPNPFKFPGVVGLPLQDTVIPEAKRLRPLVDVVVVLAPVMYPDAMQIASQAEGAVDLVLQNHEGRGAGPGVPVAVADNFLIHTGERGRQIARLELTLAGKGPFQDGHQSDRERQSLEILDRQVGEVKKRLAATTDPAQKQSYQATLESFQTRRVQVVKQLGEKKGAGRSLRLSFPMLGPDVASDPVLEAQVAKHNPVNNH